LALLFTYLALALVISFLCSMLEAVLLSITPPYQLALMSEHPARGERIAALRRDIDKPLAAILILNTVAHTVGAAGVGAEAAKLWGSSALALASAVMTLLILVLSEIIPKTIGAVYWRKLAPLSARILIAMIFAIYPLVIMARGLSSWIGRGAERAPTVSRAELRALAEVALDEGVVDETESRILRNLLRFRNVRAHDVMTPRQVLVAFEENTEVSEAMDNDQRLQFSRFPVYEGSIENVTGFVLKHDLLLKLAAGEGHTRVGELSRPVLALPEDARLPELLDAMLRNRDHMVLLTEELGGTAGIATLEDVVETLLGIEIVDETDTAVDMRELARRKWEERAARLGLPRSEH
jgi:CBS domain containing-hemolysin-like protein